MSAEPELVDILDPDEDEADADVSLREVDTGGTGNPDLAEGPQGPEAGAEYVVLPLAFLETPEEAAQEREEAASRAETVRRTTPAPSASRRSSRRGRKEPKQLSARQIQVQRRARLIIYGGMTLFALVVAAAASYKLPIMLYNMGKMEKPYVWPWGFLWREWEGEQAADTGTILRTKDGRQFNKEEIDALADEARAALAKSKELYIQAVDVYDMGEGDKVKSLVLMIQAERILQPIADQLEKVRGLQLFERLNRRTDRLVQDIGFKIGSWKKDLNFQEADRFQAELKKAGLASE